MFYQNLPNDYDVYILYLGNTDFCKKKCAHSYFNTSRSMSESPEGPYVCKISMSTTMQREWIHKR